MKRLAALQLEDENFKDAATTIDRLIGVSPLDRTVHEWSSRIAQENQELGAEIRSLQRLLLYPTTNRATVHFQLAQAHAASKDWLAARESLLRTLEEAPRYREAYVLYDQVMENLGDENQESREEPNAGN
jgi:predicted Zn-dependent protease